MTGDDAALKIAIDLMHFPSQVRVVRPAQLPDGVLMLLRIAAGDEEAISQATAITDRSRTIVSEAATFFIEQILLYPGADSYRILGAKRDATKGELRRNMALLLRWLHPDLDRQSGRSVFAARVTRAWNDLKTPERRATYDRSQRLSLAEKSLMRKKGGTLAQPRRHGSNLDLYHGTQYGNRTASRRSLHLHLDAGRGFLRRAMLLLFGKVVP
jgi:hypothetical protein